MAVSGGGGGRGYYSGDASTTDTIRATTITGRNDHHLQKRLLAHFNLCAH